MCAESAAFCAPAHGGALFVLEIGAVSLLGPTASFSSAEADPRVQPAVQRVAWLDVTSLSTLVATEDDLVCNQEVGGSIPVVSILKD